MTPKITLSTYLAMLDAITKIAKQQRLTQKEAMSQFHWLTEYMISHWDFFN